MDNLLTIIKSSTGYLTVWVGVGQKIGWPCMDLHANRSRNCEWSRVDGPAPQATALGDVLYSVRLSRQLKLNYVTLHQQKPRHECKRHDCLLVFHGGLAGEGVDHEVDEVVSSPLACSLYADALSHCVIVSTMPLSGCNTSKNVIFANFLKLI